MKSTISLLLCIVMATRLHANSDEHDAWTAPQKPFPIYGNTYYVGTQGLTAILITSPQGDILIDGTLPANAPGIEANIRALGVQLSDIKLILNTHAHIDHAGAIAKLAHDTGADVAALAKGAFALQRGGRDPDDPQYAYGSTYPKVAKVRVVADGETVRVGNLVVQAHATPGHTPGSTTWTWQSCADSRCLSMVYADSLSLLTAGHYRYTDPTHPERLADFRRGLQTLAALPCDILITPHPEASHFMQRIAARQSTPDEDPVVDPHACKAYAAQGEANMREIIAREATSR